MKKTTCRLCDSASLVLVAELNPLPLVNGFTAERNDAPTYPCGLNMCLACGHIQLTEVVDPDLIYRDYTFRTADYPWLVEHYKRMADRLMVDFAPKYAVEIGSNDGTLLRFLRARGCTVLGIDPAGLDRQHTVQEKFTSRFAASHTKADLIVANNVFAHIDDLADVVRGIKLLLNPAGVFAFEAAWAADMIDYNRFDTIYHEHLDYHTVTALVPFFRSHGLELFRVQHNLSKGGTIRGFVCHAGACPVENSVDVASHFEVAGMMHKPEGFSGFRETMAERRSNVMAELAGRNAYGYGAGAGAVATMFHLGLQSHIRTLLDDAPTNIGKFAPHSNQVVLRPDNLSGEAVVILAWGYAKQIKEKHPNMKFIVP